MRVAVVVVALAGCTDWGSYTAGNDGGARADLAGDLSLADLSATAVDMAVACADGVLDGDESDVDCGGSCASKCAINHLCRSNTDCVTAVCDIASGNTGACVYATGTPSWLAVPMTDPDYTPRYQHAAGALPDGTIALLGGFSDDPMGNPSNSTLATTEIFSPYDKSVVKGSNLNHGRERFATAWLGTQLWAIGGTDDNNGQFIEYNLYAAPVATSGWSWGGVGQVTGSHGMAAVTIESPNRDAGMMNRTFILAGRDATMAQTPSGAVRSFTNSSAVVPEPSLTLARTNLAGVAFDGRIWAIGGNGDGADGGVSPTFAEVDTLVPGDSAWAPAAPLRTARAFLQAVVAPDNRIYAIGGANFVTGDHLSSVEAFSPALGRWVRVAPLIVARGRAAAAVGGDGRIYLFGGDNANGTVRTVEAYGPVMTAMVVGNNVVVSGTNFAGDATISVTIVEGPGLLANGISDSGGVVLSVPLDVSSLAGNNQDIHVNVVDDRSNYPVTTKVHLP